MTVDKLTIGSTDLLALAETVKVTVAGPPPEPYEHSYTVDMTSKVFVLDCITTPLPPSFDQSVGRLDRCRCSMVNLDDYLKNLTNPNLVRLIRKALRTYPKRMSRAKRKEARARERRRVERDNQWWSKR